MSELLPIWNNSQLTGDTLPPTFSIPNVSGCSIKLNNQSQYWLDLVKIQTGQIVDKIEPYSYLILPNVKDIGVQIDKAQPVSSLTPDTQLVNYSTIAGTVQYTKGSTNFNGAANVQIQGDVNISNSEFDVNIQGTPTFQLAAGTTVDVGNAELNVSLTGNNTVQLASNTSVTIANSTLDVAISGTPTFNVANSSLNVSLTGENTVQLAAGTSVTVENSQLDVSLTGNNLVQLAANTKVTIENSTLDVAISGTPTFNLAAGNTVAISNSQIPVTIQGTPSFNVSNSQLDVSLTGNNTVQLAANTKVTIENSTLDVAISGTPTFNLAAGNTVAISNSQVPVTIQGTPSFQLAAGAQVQINGTPTMNIGTMPNVTVSSGTIDVSSANATIINEQLPTTQIYNAHASLTFPANTTTKTVDLQFLPNGNMVELHRGVMFVVSALGVTYTITSVTAKAAFADGHTVVAPSHFEISSMGVNTWSYGGQPCISNIFEVTLQASSAPATNDTVSIYYQVDANDTSIDVQPGYGVPIQPATASLSDASGTISAANQSEEVLAADLTSRRRYLMFQNLSDTDMYINFGSAASTGAGSILIQKLGGGITFENTLCPPDALNVYCTSSGKAFTCKYI